MGRNFDDYSGFQYKTTAAYKYAIQCTKVRFASFLSGRFTSMAVMNPPERKKAKRTSVFNRLVSKGLFDHSHVTEFFHYTFCNSNHKSDLFFCSSDKSKACGLKSLAHFSYLSF